MKIYYNPIINSKHLQNKKYLFHEMTPATYFKQHKQQALSSQEDQHINEQSKNKRKNSNLYSKLSSLQSNHSHIRQYYQQLYTPNHQHYQSIQQNLSSSKCSSQSHSIISSIQNTHSNHKKIMPTEPIYNKTIHQVLSFIKSQQLIDKEQIQNKIFSSGIFTKSKQFTNELLILDIQHSKYYQVVTLEIQLSYYKTKIKILNSKNESHLHVQGHLGGFGAFGNVYFIRFQHQQYAIKCIHFSNNNLNEGSSRTQRQKIFITVLRQYFFILLFSTLQIGPKANKIIGFDLIVTPNCIEFSTELCQNSQFNAKKSISIKKCLKTMHTLGIVHRDIKPDNIMYSRTFKKHVFIDFGGCLVLKQQIGQKTVTNFLGTTGFCIEQMFALLGSTKDFVDLYFNDLFGLKRTIEKYKQYKKNVVNLTIFNDDQKQYNKLIEEIKNPYLLLNYIKYLAFNKLHNQFIYQWKIIQKRYLGQLQQIEIELLKFFIDFQPNQTLITFYWTYLQQTVRNSDQFNQLSRIFANSLTDPLSFWKDIPSKKSLFATQVLFYRSIIINYGNYTLKQKYILKILLNKQSIQNLILPQKQNLLSNHQQNKSNNKQRKSNIYHPYLDLASYFFIVIQYCTFSQNYYQASFDDKLYACVTSLALIQTQLNPQQLKQNQVFVCPINQLKSFAKLFQYYFFNLWNQIPQIFKEESMTNCTATLFLIGYPSYLHAPLILGYHTIKSTSQKAINIIRFWKYNMILLNFGEILCDKKQANCTFLFSYVKSMEQTYIEVMQTYDFQKNSFYSLNHYFYRNVYLYREQLNELKLRQALHLLQKSYHFDEISDQQLQKWKMYMHLFIKYLASSLQMPIGNTAMYSIKQCNLTVLNNRQTCLPFLFTIPQIKSQLWSSFKQMNQILINVDRIINYQPISFRYLTRVRLKIYFRSKNYKKLKIILHLIIQNTQTYTVLNMQSISNYCYVIKGLVDREVKQFQLNFNNFFYQKSLFDQIIKRGLKMAFHFSDFSSKSNPINFLTQKNKAVNIKNTIFYMNQLHNLLYHLISILGKYLSLKSKVQKSVYFIQNSQNFEEKYETVYIQNINQLSLCLQSLSSNLNLKPYLTNHRQSTNEYVSYLMNIFIQKRQFKSAVNVFEQYFGFIKIDELKKLTLQVLPSLRTFTIYCMLKVQISNHDQQWNENFVQLFQYCLKNSYILNPMKQPFIYKTFFQALIHCQRSYQQIQQFIHFVTQSLKKVPTKTSVENCHIIFESRLWCKCKKCFPKLQSNWNPGAFCQFIQKKIPTYIQRQDSYMSLIFYYFLQNRLLSMKSRKKFINFIRKSLRYLSLPIRSFITHRLHFYELDYFNQISGLHSYFQSYKNKFKSQPNISTTQAKYQEAQFLHGLRQKFEQRAFKNSQIGYSLADTVGRQFFINRIFYMIGNCRYGQIRYHFVKQNYRPQYPPSMLQVVIGCSMKKNKVIQQISQ